MRTVTGVVDKIGSTQTRNGGYVYRITVDGTNYGCGFDQPDCSEGDTVEFQAEKKGQYWNVAKGTLKKVEGVPKTSPKATGGGGGYSPEEIRSINRRECLLKAMDVYRTKIDNNGLDSTLFEDILITTEDMVDYITEGLPEYLEAMREARLIEELENNTDKDRDPLGEE